MCLSEHAGEFSEGRDSDFYSPTGYGCLRHPGQAGVTGALSARVTKARQTAVWTQEAPGGGGEAAAPTLEQNPG